ncbi:Cortactin-binding protein 2 [Bienertia sinuspersici]
MTSTCGNVTLRFWHGGKFSEAKTGELVYLGGQGKTVLFDPDELCYFDIMKSATESGQYETVSGVYYLIPGLAMAEGLRKVVDDGSVIEMGELALKYRTIDLYVLHQSDDPCLSPTPQPKSATMPTNNQPLIKPKKMTPMRAPPKPSGKSPRKSPRLAAVIFEGHSLDPKSPPKTSQIPLSQNFISESLEDVFLDSYDWVDPRPESPIPLNQLISEPSDDDEDSLYEPEEENTSEEEDIEGVDAEEVQDEFEVEENGEELFAAEELLAGESDNDDEEYYVARERVRTCTTRLNEIAQQLQVEAAEGRLKCAGGEKNRDRTTDQGYESEYYDREDDMQTPPNSDEEIDVGRRGRRSTLVGSETDFAKFQWKVGQRFATRDGFKQAVAKYGIMQGRNVSVVVSNKTRRQDLGVKCVKDCPFYLYASWHSQKASYLVKRVVSEHKCHRNMKKNRQFKSTWVANEMLEVFKARPHWPAKEIKDTIKRAYKVLVNRQFAYKVKYNAHKLLHGSMHEHYQKLGRYMAAMEASSPNSVVDLVVDTVKGVNPPVFQRLFTCFEGLQKGWKEGCRKVICVDAAFLKTFLGGQILAAVGRDANEQMFPIAWAVVEGENNKSWEWFFNHLKVCLGLGDGEGYAIISDEHQVSFLTIHLITLICH